MVFSLKRSLAGPGYIILNCIRVLNIIALGSVIAASIVLLIRNLIVSNFFFFDAVSHIVTVIVSGFLIVSELSLFRNYYTRNWPLLSLTHGFVTLGVLMIVTGAQTLGSLNKPSADRDGIGASFFQVVLAAGVVCFVMGFANIAASYLFRTKSVGVTARMVRAYGATAQQRAGDVYFAAGQAAVAKTPSCVSAAASVRNTPSVRTAVSPRRSFSGPDTLPSYHAPDHAPRRATAGLNISAPVPHDPEQFAKFKGAGDVRQPEMAAHPAYQGGRF